MVQEKPEITELTKFLHNLSPKNVMEIGTKLGGTFEILCNIATGKKISIDLPGGIHGGWITKNHPYMGDVYKVRNEYFKKNHKHTYTITGDSHKLSTLRQVLDILENEQLDFLFIDGDHTLEGVTKDYEMYKHLVKPGGWIAFHDINDTEHHRSLNVYVGKFWKNLKGVKKEFNINKHWAGIGVIQVK
jgi:cephalosporin hydroxylase